MNDHEFFPPRPDIHPMIYAYKELNPDYEGLLKVGYTEIDIEQRVAQQYPTKRPDGKMPYRIVLREPALYDDGSTFTDHDVHRVLKKRNPLCSEGGEWFRCTVDEVRAAVIAVKTRSENLEERTLNFKMRPEQIEAVQKTAEYFKNARQANPTEPPRFLWNAKMRFGKTFAAYQLAKKMNFNRVLVLTFKPAVEDAWEEDLTNHVDFEGWQFISRGGFSYEKADKSRPIVCFGSFQDYMGYNSETGGIKAKNEWVHTMNWDIVIFDEYHFGAWRDNARKLFEETDEDQYDALDLEKYKKEEADNAERESRLPITSYHYLFLSGTPFRALNSGEFVEDQVYSWTYSDEQRAKNEWVGKNNPYACMPRMVLMTYKIPDEIARIAQQGEFDEFDLNVFFSAKGAKIDARFVYEDYVQKWLDLIRGSYLSTTVDDLKLGREKPPMPYSDTRLLNVLQHTFWFLPNVASCYAMRNLLAKKQNTFFHDYKVNVCAGPEAGIGLDALAPVRRSMVDPLNSKTITLSCGKLTTGVTVRPWTGIFVLRSLSTPETYFQAAFRVQSPWEVPTENGLLEIVKKECYIFDFALSRALRQVSEYSCSLNVNEANPEKKVGDFIKFLPVLAFNGSTMKAIDPSEILDITMAGTSATLLARRWQSALLVNVDNATLSRLLANQEAMNALMSIEGFRNLNQDIETIINKSDAVKKAKRDTETKLTPKEKKDLSDEEKEFKTMRKKIQDKLIKFATRIPIFMYLTDFREYSLKDVITQFEPGLFKKVTGLTVKEFDLLVSLGVFNHTLMNGAVYNFKRYEDASLSYAGIDKHQGEKVGGWDTVLTREEYEMLYYNQQSTLQAPFTISDVLDTNYTTDFEESDEGEDKPESIPVLRPARSEIEDDYSGDFVTGKYGIKSPTPDYKPKRSMDLSGVVPGVLVWHQTFGEGNVTSIEKTKVSVNFGIGTKHFAFPSAFEDGFLQIRKNIKT